SKCEQEEGLFIDEADMIPLSSESRDLIQHIISDHHNAVVGHGGYATTAHKIRASGYVWPSMYKDVADFVRVCPICQKIKDKKIPKAPKLSISVEIPFHTLFVDTLTISKEEEPEKYVIAVVDAFTHWVELIPVESLEKEVACSALIPILARHGLPEVIHTDGGSQFCNYLADHLWDTLRVKHHVSIAHHPTGNGVVERVNREIKKHMCALFLEIMFENQWTRYVPIVQGILNNTLHSSIGCTPFEMLRGRQPSRVVHANHVQEMKKSEKELPEQTKEGVKEYVTDLALKIDQLHRRAEMFQRKRTEKGEGEEPELVIGSFVLKRRLSPEGKLYADLMGPYKVEEKISQRLYLLKSIVNETDVEETHIDEIVPFNTNPDSDIEEMRALAARDYGWVLVDEVMEHKRVDGCLMLKIRWKGWSHETTTWQSYESLKSLIKVKDYVKKKRIRKLK
ncbi:DDE-type integrase/transposase/recombinase, partial [Aduncisulcus paluster]